MKINNPLQKEFPFNVNSQIEYDFHTKRLKKQGFTELYFGRLGKFPYCFSCINRSRKQYVIY